MNVNGEQFLPLIQHEETFSAFLAGANMAVDLNNIIKSIDGEVALSALSIGKSNSDDFSFVAELAHSHWIADVDYWKTSCPKGSSIGDWGKGAYYYTDGSKSYYFGVKNEQEKELASSSPLVFFSGSTRELAQRTLLSASAPVSQDVLSGIENERFVAIVNLQNLESKGAPWPLVRSVLSHLLGDVHTAVYVISQ